MKKIAIIMTNYDRYGSDAEATGLWLAEATEFVNIVTHAGYEVDYISPLGGAVPLDPRSLKRLYVKEADRILWETADFQERALKRSRSVTEVKAEDYVAIYYTGNMVCCGTFQRIQPYNI